MYLRVVSIAPNLPTRADVQLRGVLGIWISALVSKRTEVPFLVLCLNQLWTNYDVSILLHNEKVDLARSGGHVSPAPAPHSAASVFALKIPVCNSTLSTFGEELTYRSKLFLIYFVANLNILKITSLILNLEYFLNTK